MRVLFSRGLIAISKPRCGSTSVRQVLDRLVDPSKGDIAVNMANQHPPYHPHLSAPHLKFLLTQDGHDISKMKTFVITRNPLDMLWSYFNFFVPDSFGQYNYSAKWTSTSTISFENWVLNGRVGMSTTANAFAPKWISTRNLSPLSLEAHIEDRNGKIHADKIFMLENIEEFVAWLSEQTGTDIEMRHVNKSTRGILPKFGTDLIDRVRKMFPKESELYAI